MPITIAHFIESEYSKLLLNDDLSCENPLIDDAVDSSYNIELFRQDNHLVCNWFHYVTLLFASWQRERNNEWDPQRLVITGSRSFGASYTESDIECAIVSTNFDDFLQFCVFLNERYAKTHHFEALKTKAGLPLLTIRKNGPVFNCPLLRASYPQTVLPKLEITFRHPNVHQKIQAAGEAFFGALPEEALISYAINKRYINNLLKNPKMEHVFYGDKPIRTVLSQLKSDLMRAIMIFEKGGLQSTPKFNDEILKRAIQTQIPLSFPSNQISNTLRLEAELLLTTLMSTDHATEQEYPLRLLVEGRRLTPDDWALGQEHFERGSPWFHFFQQHRNELSSQLNDGKYHTCVPIITFDFQDELHVLLMKNEGLKNSSDVNEIEWTAHGVRVDMYEQERMSPELWSLMGQLSGEDHTQQLLLAAAWRRISEMGITVTPEQWLEIHTIDRDQAGIAENSSSYKTTYIHVHLGQRIPEKIIARCHTSASRYGQWTECFNVGRLASSIKESQNPAKKRELYQLEHGGQTLTVRFTSMSFILALSMLETITPDKDIHSPWDLRNPSSLERALTWIMRRIDASVQITLFSALVNRLSSPQIHAFANKARMNEENLAALSLKPERLVLYHLLAQLVMKTRIKDKNELQLIINQLIRNYQECFPSRNSDYEEQFNRVFNRLNQLAKDYPFTGEIPVLEEPDRAVYEQMHALHETLRSTSLSNTHKAIYSLTESDTEIAILITAYTIHHQNFSQMISQDVEQVVQQAIDNGQLQPLEIISLEEQLFFGFTGPVASGKSVSEDLAKKKLQGQGMAFISSDEWNEILIAVLSLGNYQKQCGKLTLAEAWFIKNLMWDLLHKMAEKRQTVHISQEAMNPASLRLPEQAESFIFINTARPELSIERVWARGERSGRYVSGSDTFSSYRWPWQQLIAVIEKGMVRNPRMQLVIVDTDIYYSMHSESDDLREKSSTIAHLQNNVLDIHHLKPFIDFVNRGYMINPAPRNASDGWLMSSPNLDLFLKEIEKLFNPKHQLIVQLNGSSVSYLELCTIVTRFMKQSHLLNNVTQSGVNKMLEFHKWLEQLSEPNKKLLSYYGSWDMSSKDRADLSITESDEYDTIRRSLFLLQIVLQGDTVQEIKDIVARPYEFNGFVFPGIPSSDALEKNITTLLLLRDDARDNYQDSADEYLIRSFIVHDLGKMRSFITEFGLAPDGNISAVGHDGHLKKWLKTQPTLRDFGIQYVMWVKHFDGLGHNPQKLAEDGFVNILSIVNETTELLKRLNEVSPSTLRDNKFESFNYHLYQNALALNLPGKEFSFLIDHATARTPWPQLSWEQRQKITMLIWCGPLIFVKPPLKKEEVREAFISLWQSGQHQSVIDELTFFMITNMVANESNLFEFKFLYNTTGLLHHHPSRGISHFSLNGTVAELFTIFIPFVLKVVKEESFAKSSCDLDGYQALQLIESDINFFSYFASGVKTQEWRHFNFASKECKEAYTEYFNQKRAEAAEQASCAASSSSSASSSSAPGSYSAAFFVNQPLPHETKGTPSACAPSCSK